MEPPWEGSFSSPRILTAEQSIATTTAGKSSLIAQDGGSDRGCGESEYVTGIENMAATCFKCGKELALPSGTVGRSAECSCGADARVCLNCKHFDRSCYNECREPQAERVLDKDRRNQCDYFSLRQSGPVGAIKDGISDARKKLDDLFKK